MKQTLDSWLSKCPTPESNRYSILMDNIDETENVVKKNIATAEDATNVGRLTILPATYVGSSRHLHEYAKGAMTYVRTYGRPDLFITFTCNPKWPEMTILLFPGQTSSDRHDSTALMKVADDRTDGIYFLDAPGGTGKTFVFDSGEKIKLR